MKTKKGHGNSRVKLSAQKLAFADGPGLVPCTMRVASVWAPPSSFQASQVYFPVSSGKTSWITKLCSLPLRSKWKSSDCWISWPLCSQATWGWGQPGPEGGDTYRGGIADALLIWDRHGGNSCKAVHLCEGAIFTLQGE